MTDTSQEDVPPQTNGIVDGIDEVERAKMRPADIDADVREMERRKRVEMIMNSKLFREELERIIETQLKEGSGTSALMQQISDMMGVNKQAGNVFKSSSCVIPINDIRGIESMGYAKGEKILRCKVAAVYRLIDLYGWSTSSSTLVTARLNQDEEHFLVNPYGMLFHEITASSLIKVDMQGGVVEQGTTNFSVNITAFSLHAAVHAARPDIKCIIHVHTPSVVAISAMKQGLLPISKESVVIGEVSVHTYLGGMLDSEEKDKLARNLGPNNKVLLLTNQGALCCGETIEEAFFHARNTVLASESQLKLIPVGIDNLVLLSDEARKKIYEVAHKPPESSPRPDQPSILEGKVERKWRIGGVEFEGLMRMLDNAGFRTGYIYRHPLVKGDPPRPKNDVEVPPAVSSLGYLLEEEELYRQGLWKKIEGGKKGHDRSRWLNSPNVYQKVEILETGTPDPKKITKWVAEGSPTHSSTPVKIDSALQFVPRNTNPKEFKEKQQQIKDYRRADKKSAGPQSHILEGVTWEEARKMQDATVTQTGDHVVLMGAASKGIIQRGHQHNATVYKSPYAKNPFDSVTDEELDEYKKVVERKAKGDYTDTDLSESELSSAAINKRMDSLNLRSPTSETEEESREEPQVLRIETTQAPRPSQPEVVLSDEVSTTEHFLKAERASVNSYRNFQALQKEKRKAFIETMHTYRTNSHAGFPKGSYTVPNPTHFHIAHSTQAAVPEKPMLVKLGSLRYTSHYVFGQLNVNRSNANPVVTMNIGHTHSVSFDISMETIRGFIMPFANALNFIPERSSQTNQASQTTYIKSSETISKDSEQIIKENERNTGNKFEEAAIEKLARNLFGDMDNRDFHSCSNESDDACSNVTSSVNEFTDEDHLIRNESLIDITSFDLVTIDCINSCDDTEAFFDDEDDISERKYFFSFLPFVEDSFLEDSEKSIKEDELVQLVTFGPDFDLFEEIINDAKLILEQLPYSSVSNDEILENVTNESITNKISFSETSNNQLEIDQNKNNSGNTKDSASSDEGIELSKTLDCLNHIKESITDERVKKLSSVIYDYLMEQCFEIKELILFPEITNDIHITKLMSELKNIYKKLYTEAVSAANKNELRINIFKTVMSLLEVEERARDCSDDSSDNISDKIFSISEFLSEILDLFFSLYIDDDNPANDSFKDFSEVLNKIRYNIQHSTPEILKEETSVIKETDNPSLEKKQLFDLVERNDKFIEYKQNFSTESSIVKEKGKSLPEVKRLSIATKQTEKVVTAFKKSVSPKTGSESYWISINKAAAYTPEASSPPRDVCTCKCRKAINVDDIPLRPPPDLDTSLRDEYLSKPLSPVPEEPRCVLFGDSYVSESDNDDYVSNDEVDDILAQGDGPGVTYMAFEKPEMVISKVDIPERNVIIEKDITFNRSSTASSPFTESDTVTFKKTKLSRSQMISVDFNSSDSFRTAQSKSIIELDESEGDWMGYEAAKF